MIIKFNNISSNLGTRSAGEEVRKEILLHLNNDEKIIFDLNGVEVISNSFADECFAKLIFTFPIEKIKQNTTFQNTTPFIRTVIATAFKERLFRLQES